VHHVAHIVRVGQNKDGYVISYLRVM